MVGFPLLLLVYQRVVCFGCSRFFDPTSYGGVNLAVHCTWRQRCEGRNASLQVVVILWMEEIRLKQLRLVDYPMIYRIYRVVCIPSGAGFLSHKTYHCVDDIPFESLRALETRQRFFLLLLFSKEVLFNQLHLRVQHSQCLGPSKRWTLISFTRGTTICSGKLPRTLPKTNIVANWRIDPSKRKRVFQPTIVWCKL